MVDSNTPDNNAADTNGLPTQQPVSLETLSFYQRYNKAMLAWTKTHGNTRFPIYEDPVDGKLKWANRAMRRKWARLQNRGIKAYVHNYR